MRDMINKMPSGKKYIFSVLSAVRGFMVATPLLALVKVAQHQLPQQYKGQILNCGMNFLV